MLCLGVATFIAVGIATWTSVQNISLLRDQTYTGQRAYLIIDNVRLHGRLDICSERPKFGEMNVALIPSTPSSSGTPMWLPWDVKNTGLTPALNIRQRFRFYIGTERPPVGSGDPFGGTRVALGPGQCDPSPDAPWVWLDRRNPRDGTSPRYWMQDDVERISPTGGERLWVVISVDYDTAFKGVTGFSTFCGYYDSSLFTSCGNVVE